MIMPSKSRFFQRPNRICLDLANKAPATTGLSLKLEGAQSQDGGRVDSVVFENPLPLGWSYQCCHRQLDLPNVLQGELKKNFHKLCILAEFPMKILANHFQNELEECLLLTILQSFFLHFLKSTQVVFRIKLRSTLV